MSLIRFQISLNDSDFRLLSVLAIQEYRDPRQQAGILIREALQSRGLLENAENGERSEALKAASNV